jgi:hypothetical protein
MFYWAKGKAKHLPNEGFVQDIEYSNAFGVDLRPLPYATAYFERELLIRCDI